MSHAFSSEAPSPPVVVTVIVTTYNHAAFIGQCLDSVLMQRTRDLVDIVVLDDCSTDGTQAILLGYQRRYPERVHLLRSEVNRANCAAFADAVLSASTPYVAVLDGDDYWTRDDKLQQQVDYLDRHPACALCFHNVSEVYDDGSRPPRNSNPPDQKAVSNLSDLLESCFVETCSTLYRRSALPEFPAWYVNDRSADWSMAVIAARRGTIDYIDEVMAVYRRHAGGVWSGATREDQELRVIAFYEQMLGYLSTADQPQVASLLARRSYELAWAYRDAGRTGHADRFFAKAHAAEPDPRKLAWAVRTAPHNTARLVFPEGPSDRVRVEIDGTTPGNAFDIQLNHAHLAVRAHDRYMVRFRARAERPRALAVGIAQAHEPWLGLGYYRQVGLSTDWRTVEEEFVATGTTPNARLHFDLGGDDAAVDVSSVSLAAAAGQTTTGTGRR